MTDREASLQHVTTLARMYARQVRAMSYADLCERQAPPWASVKLGAAGLVYALSQPNTQRLRLQDLATAERLLRQSAKRLDDPGAFLGTQPPLSHMDVRSSIHFGREGIELVRVLLAARRGATSTRLALRSLLQTFRRAPGHSVDLLFGTPGVLNALLILHREIPDEAVRAVADMHAESLLDSGRAEGGWATLAMLCLAHGRAAAAHALLGWSLAFRRELPGWFHDELARLSSDIDREGRMGAPAGMPLLTASWCNGAAGLVLLWARAYEVTGDRKHRARARAAARFVATKTDGPGDLCCGLAGSSFALLAMDRIEPDKGWDTRALTTAALAVDRMLERTNDFPNGLFGFPGFICLARDLSSPRARRLGFPLIEG